MNKITLLIFFTIFSIVGKTQIDSVRSLINGKLLNHIAETNWLIDTSDNLVSTIYKIDTFSVCSMFNPIKNHQKHDTLFISFRFEENWSPKKIDSIQKHNLAILKPIVPKYIAYYDSVGWEKARIKKQQLLEQPKSSVLQDWFKSKYISEEERMSLFKLIRLPDTLIGTIGVFHERNFPPMYIIKPEVLEREVDTLLNKLNKDVLLKTTILRNEGFFLTSPFKEGI